MEAIYKKKEGVYFSMQTGRQINPKHVEEIGPFCWHCHGNGYPVVEVGEYEDNHRRDANTYVDEFPDSEGGYSEDEKEGY